MSFSAVKPLPGQRGYNMRESDKLAEETREMQINLMKIQEQMKRVKSDNGENTGGRWRSARSERGTLRKYNKDIKSGSVRNSSKRGGPREMTNNNTGGRRRTFKHQVHEWTGREVTMWLRALKLDQYLETFARNEITGSVLLDLGQSDLDYMQIKALGHRKIIMREIERLKRGKSSVDLRQGGTMDASPPKKASSPTSRQQSQRDGRGKRLLTVNNSDSTPDLSLNGTSTSTSSNTSTQNNGQQQQQQQRFRFAAAETDTSPQQRQRQEQLQRSKSNENRRAHAGSKSRSPSSSPQRTVQHWSHVKPISENEITGDGTVPVNLADGDYNEARQQQAFQQAVNE